MDRTLPHHRDRRAYLRLHPHPEPALVDNNQTDDSSPEDDMAGLLRQQWRVIEGGKLAKVRRDNTSSLKSLLISISSLFI